MSKSLVRLGLHASVIEMPISEIKLKAYGISREEAIRRATDAIRYATQNGIRVAFFGVDGTRADLEFLKQIYAAAIDAGAKEVVLVDTIGVCTPEAAEFLVRWAKDWIGDGTPIHWHGHNDFGSGDGHRHRGGARRRDLDPRHHQRHGRTRR